MRTLKALLVILVLQALLFSQGVDRQISYGPEEDSEVCIVVNPQNENILLATWNNFNYYNNRPSPGFNFSFNGSTLDWPITYPTFDILEPPYLQHGQTPNIYGFDPSCGFNLNGRAFYCFIASPDLPTNNYFGSVFLAYSDDYEGWEFTEVHEGEGDPSGNPPSFGDDKSFMAVDTTVDPNYVYISWTDGSSGSSRRIYFSRSVDGGINFSPPYTIDEISGEGVYYSTALNPYFNEEYMEEETDPFIQGSMPVVDPTTGDLYVFWTWFQDANNGDDFKIYYRKSTDKGLNFELKDTVKSFSEGRIWNGSLGSLYTHSIPIVTICPVTGNFYITLPFWNGNPQDYIDIKMLKSTNGGINWTVIQMPREGQQVQPWISVDNNGTLFLTYYSNHEFIGQTNVNLYMNISYDGGATFSNPIQISDYESDASNDRPPPQYKGPKSDYIGIGTTYGIAYPAWTDFRDGKSNIYTDKVMIKPADPQNLDVEESANHHPLLTWNANPEPNIDHYIVYRAVNPTPLAWEFCNPIEIGTTSHNFFEDTDITLNTGSYGPLYASYAIKAVNNLPRPYISDYSNSVVVRFMQDQSTEKSVEYTSLPNEMVLLPNYPNPFNPETTIRFCLNEDQYINLSVYSTTGEKIISLVDKYVSKGYHNVTWNGKNKIGELVSSGMYFYVLMSGDKRIIKKMVILR